MTGGGPPRVGGAGDVRWLTDAEQRTWRGLIPLLHALPAALDRQLQLDAGIPHAYYVILAMLSEAPGRELRMSDLAQITATSLSRLSHAVARLEENGWVSRRRCADDRRAQLARLTDAGMERLVELAPGHVEEVRRLVFDTLTAEQLGQLDAITARIRAALAAANGLPSLASIGGDPAPVTGRADHPDGAATLTGGGSAPTAP
jgi:DNA-binding MarR family transcriptional regulator